ncbi:MAG: penicillin-binding protein 2, partial [Saprospiraceae bacterium]|nr:penicillin-binding protein 2 [Saprospiraceae bacterium]
MSDSFNTRKFSIRIVFIIGALALITKAMFIQLIDDTYSAKGSTAGIDKITVYPSRGLIFDRNGKLLVNNVPVYDLMVVYNRLDPQMDTTAFCNLLGISKGEFKERIEKDWRDQRYSKVVPYVFLSRIPADTFARFQEHLYEYPGFYAQIRNIRSYPYPNAAHLLGYIREVNQDDIDKGNGEYRSGDYIGAAGLELAYEELLKGEKGAKFILKDKFGREVGSYKDGSLDTLPLSGKDLISTIDVDLQAYGEFLMQGKTGSIVAIEPSTGEILAMASLPTYDPNRLSINSSRGKAFQELLDDPRLPFFDRTVMAQYPPGSIFKTVVALIALQEGVISPQTGFTCSNGYFYNGRLYGCHSHVYPGSVTTAIQHSCNSYFWQTFRRIIDKKDFYKPREGLDMFNNYVYQFGLGNELGVDFPREKGGNVPTSDYYDKVYKKGGWKSPTIMSLGIGQGELQLTSMQMANLAAIMANRGHYYTPHLVKSYKNDASDIDEKYRTKHEIDINKAFYQYVIDGMEKVVTSGT